MTNIRGTVTDDTETAVEGATVAAVDSTNGGVIGTTTTDANGDYEIVVDTDTTAHAFAEWVDGGTVYRALSKHSLDVSPEVVVVESFEAGNLDDYEGDTVSFTVESQEFAIDGSNVLNGIDVGSNFEEMKRTGGTDPTPSRGETFTFYVRTTNASASVSRAGMQFVVQSNTQSYCNVTVRWDQPDMQIQEWVDGSANSFNDFDFQTTPADNVWYQVDVDFGETTTDDITATATNLDTDEVAANGTITATQFDTGDIGWSVNNDGAEIYYDYAHIPQ